MLPIQQTHNKLEGKAKKKVILDYTLTSTWFKNEYILSDRAMYTHRGKLSWADSFQSGGNLSQLWCCVAVELKVGWL